MARPATKDLTEREMEVMQLFWASGEMTAQEARDRLALAGRERSYPTVANLVRALHEKGFLRPINDDRPFRYRTDKSRDAVSGRLLSDLVERVFGGSREQLFVQLLDGQKLTASERAVLESILREGDA